MLIRNNESKTEVKRKLCTNSLRRQFAFFKFISVRRAAHPLGESRRGRSPGIPEDARTSPRPGFSRHPAIKRRPWAQGQRGRKAGPKSPVPQ